MATSPTPYAFGAVSNSFQQPFTRRNRQYQVDPNNSTPVWMQHEARIRLYDLYWKFYLGAQWEIPAPPGIPQLTINYTQKFVDKHNTFLFGNGFTVNGNFGKMLNQTAADLLNENWEKNSLKLTALELGLHGGVTGDCWVNVGLEEDPIFGTRVRYTPIPSAYCFPIFRHQTSRTFDALLIQWPDTTVLSSDFGKMQTKSVMRGWYWTKDEFWEMEDGKPIGGPQTNYLGEIPFVHIPNVNVGSFWGRSDLASIIDLGRDVNMKFTDCSEIIHYHAAPVTILYGVKVSALQKGANKTWAVPKDSKVEVLQMPGDLGASIQYLDKLRQALFELGSMTPVAFGGADAISNTSGVALALQFAPLIDHMKMRRVTYEAGIQQINYLTLKFFELLGTYKANGAPLPYYSGVTWTDPLPRDAAVQMQLLTQMQQLQMLSRVQVMRELIHQEIAPQQYEVTDAEQLVNDAMQEELKWQEQFGEAQMAPQVEAQQAMAAMQPATPAQPPTPQTAPKSKHNSVSAAEQASRKAEQKRAGGSV